LEIEEKINQIKWCKRPNAAHFLLSTNGKKFFHANCVFSFSFLFFLLYFFSLDKTIKLWKVYERSLKVVTDFNMMTDSMTGSLERPKLDHQDTIVAAVPRRLYANGMFCDCSRNLKSALTPY
jgi:serine/threonine-protein phosphatase 2A regulatory subunit B